MPGQQVLAGRIVARARPARAVRRYRGVSVVMIGSSPYRPIRRRGGRGFTPSGLFLGKGTPPAAGARRGGVGTPDREPPTGLPPDRRVGRQVVPMTRTSRAASTTSRHHSEPMEFEDPPDLGQRPVRIVHAQTNRVNFAGHLAFHDDRALPGVFKGDNFVFNAPKPPETEESADMAGKLLTAGGTDW